MLCKMSRANASKSVHAGFAHERRIRRHALDERVGVQLEHSGFVRAVGKNFYFEIGKIFHVLRKR